MTRCQSEIVVFLAVFQIGFAAVDTKYMKAEEVRLLFIRAEFSDAPMGIPDSQWRQRLLNVNSVAEIFYVRDSFGKISGFDDSYTNVFVLPNPSTDYQGSENVYALRADMVAAAENAGWDITDFEHIVLSYPGVLNQPFGAAAVPGTVWLPGDNPWGPGFTHEMGHAFGVGHASSIEGDGVPFPGQHREGRDGLHMMGSDDGRQSHTNLPMKYVMGFVQDDFISQQTENGAVRIYAFDKDSLPDSANNKLAGVFNVNGNEFWISFAPGMAEVWSDFGGSVWQHGVEVHQLEGAITRILDFTPGSRGSGNTADYWDTRDGALTVGTTYQFPDSTIAITPFRTGIGDGNREWIDVYVQFTAIIPGDVNLDGNVNLLDVHPFVNVLSSGSFQPAADLNGDGSVDLLDVSMMVNLLAGN